MTSLQQLLSWEFSQEDVNILDENGFDFKTLLQMTSEDFHIFNIGIALGKKIKLFKCLQEHKKNFSSPANFETNENLLIIPDAITPQRNAPRIATDSPKNVDDASVYIKEEFQDVEFSDFPENSAIEDPEMKSVFDITPGTYDVVTNEQTGLGQLKRKSQGVCNAKTPAKKQMTQDPGSFHCHLPCGHNDVANTIFPPAFKLTEYNICRNAIEAVIKDSLEGEAIFTEYETTGTLKENSRNLLVSLIVNRCDVKNIRRPPAFLERCAKAVIELLPNEDQEIYFIAAHTQGNESKNARGKFTSKWRNIMFRLRSASFFEKKASPPEENLQPSTSIEAVLDEKVSDRITWLQSNREPWDDVKKHWNSTYDYRRRKNSELKTTDALIQDWPILKSNIGAELIKLDFTRQYPGKESVLEEKWEDFFNSLYNLRKHNFRDEVILFLCKAYERLAWMKSANVDGLRVLILPHLVPPMTRVKTPVGMKKPFKSECAEGFVVWCKTRESIISTLQARTRRYQELQLPSQPCAVLVGPEADKIETSFVFVDHFLWKAETPRQTVDVLMNLYAAINFNYPFDCEHVWLVIQKHLYDIHTKNDKKIVIVTSTLASLSKK